MIKINERCTPNVEFGEYASDEYVSNDGSFTWIGWWIPSMFKLVGYAYSEAV